MKVLFQNQDANWIGGDVVQLNKTREALEKLGIETRFSSKSIADPQDIIDVDWVHCFNFSMPWSKYQIWNAKKLGKKVACSMVYHETDAHIDYPTQQAMMNELDAAIFLTEGELHRVQRHLTILNSIIHFIPNGIDKWWFKKPDKIIESDVLTVGRLDPHKGQLAVAQACRRLGLNYTCIGDQSKYGEMVKVLGAKVLPPMKQEDLKPYYAGCKVYAQVSSKEVFPLSVMEAGSQARNIVLTNGCEWDIPCERAEYNNIDDICRALEVSLLKSPNIAFRDQLKELTWDKVALDLKKIYETA